MEKNATYKDFISITKFSTHITVKLEIPSYVRFKMTLEDLESMNINHVGVYHYGDGFMVMNFIFKPKEGNSLKSRYMDVAALKEYLVMNMELDGNKQDRNN